MRVTSELWTSALARRVFADGGFAAVLRRGAAEAGAIFIVVRGRDGSVSLFSPAPQADYGTGRPEERAFSPISVGSEDELARRLEREERFDSDLWIVEVEPGRTPPAELFSVSPP